MKADVVRAEKGAGGVNSAAAYTQGPYGKLQTEGAHLPDACGKFWARSKL